MTLEAIVSNSAGLIGLHRIQQLDLLPQLIPQVFAPMGVIQEIGFQPNWLLGRSLREPVVALTLQNQLGKGESEAIALVLELENVQTILLDDKKARRIAKRMGIQVIGTLGILLKAKQQGLISRVKPLLLDLKSVGFHISSSLYAQALELAEESEE